MNLIKSPSNKLTQLAICIPVYKRVSELHELIESIEHSIQKHPIQVFFLLNGVSSEIRDNVINSFGSVDNYGILEFEENTGEAIFQWPFFNLKNEFIWIIGDDDKLLPNIDKAIDIALTNDVTILNYDLYDKSLSRSIKNNFLGRKFDKSRKQMTAKSMFTVFGHLVTFISCVIVRKSVAERKYSLIPPLSFSYASLIYHSLSSKTESNRIAFFPEIALRQRGANIANSDMDRIDDIFLNEIRSFYFGMMKSETFRMQALISIIKLTVLSLPFHLYRSRRQGRAPKIAFFGVFDKAVVLCIFNILRVTSHVLRFFGK
jgi:hypothetical protein